MTCYPNKEKVIKSNQGKVVMNSTLYEYNGDILEIQMYKLKEECDGYMSLDTKGNVDKIYYLASPVLYESRRYNSKFKVDIGDKQTDIDKKDILDRLQCGQGIVFMHGKEKTYFQMYNIKGDWYVNRSVVRCDC